MALGGRTMALARDRKTRQRSPVMLGALAAGGVLLVAHAAAAQGCTREILQGAADDYIAAQQTADVTTMHVGLWVDYNEQLQPATMSTGVLSKPMKVDFHRELLDTAACKVFSEVVIADPAHPYVIGTVITTGGGPGSTGPDFVGAISSVVTDKANGWLFDPASTLKYSKAESWSPIPAADRDSRQTLQAAADAYLDLFNDKNAKVPWGTPCARLEGGAYTSKAQPGSLNPDDSCNVGVPTGVPIVDRTYVIDPDLGAVAVLSHFGKDQEPDVHAFRIEHGKIKYVHTITACIKVANCGVKAAPPAQAQATR
jgi:hypothetical protein